MPKKKRPVRRSGRGTKARGTREGAGARRQAKSRPRTGYAPVNGLRMYYEIHGSGTPVLVLHGGVVGISMFGSNVEALAVEHQVIAPELQGHGHTADIERPLSFAHMADAVAALARHLGIERAAVLGYSLGAGVAIQLALGHPDLVAKLVVVSQPCRRSGWYPEVLAAFDHMGPAAAEPLTRSPLAKLYPNVDWAVLFTKLGELLRQDYDWSPGLAAMKTPAMLVFADADAITPEHVVEFWGLLGGGKRDAGLDGSRRPTARLAILPGLSHYTIGASADLAKAVLPFLKTS